MPRCPAVCPLSEAKRKTEPFRFRPRSRTTATSILPSLNCKTARSWRGIIPFTHLAREGRMTVTIGRRELLAALGGAVVTWPLAARAQQPKVPTIGALVIGNISPEEFWREFRQGLRDLGYIEGQNIR